MLNLKHNIILGSQSPRRAELLKGLDVEFEIRVISTDEVYPSEMTPEQVPVFLSKNKAAAHKGKIAENELLITADTVVILADRIFEKASNEKEGIEMLSQLSGKAHKVVSGVTISTDQSSKSFSDTSYVTFKEFAPDEIEYYINKYKPFDKAGSYGVQEWLGYVGIEKLEGSYYNVMGLPVHKLYSYLKDF